MSSAAQVAAAREETRKKLHEKIESYEKGELGQEYHRTFPFKIPTAIAAAGSGEPCAGRNSLNRYLRATGFSGLEVETAQETPVMFSLMEKKPLMSRSIMKLPVKVPGKELEFLMVPILDEDDRFRDFPIKLHEHLLPKADDRILFPILRVPESGLVYDLFPFPAEGDSYDEKQTVIFSKARGGPLLPKKQLEQQLSKGIVCVLFEKLNNREERTLRGTTYQDFIPKSLQGKSHSATDESNEGAETANKIGEDQVVMFDVDLQSWRSFKYSSIIQLRVRLHPYDTFPGPPPIGQYKMATAQSLASGNAILSGPAICDLASNAKK